MPRMTPELILLHPSYLSPLKDRELDLRGNKIPAIENLGVVKVRFVGLCVVWRYGLTRMHPSGLDRLARLDRQCRPIHLKLPPDASAEAPLAGQ